MKQDKYRIGITITQTIIVLLAIINLGVLIVSREPKVIISLAVVSTTLLAVMFLFSHTSNQKN